MGVAVSGQIYYFILVTCSLVNHGSFFSSVYKNVAYWCMVSSLVCSVD